MTKGTSMGEIEADIEDITRTLWATLFDLPLSRGEVGELGREGIVTGCVQIVGGWRGAVVLQCPMPLATTLAEQMFQAESTPTLDEVRDALGELTNVIGGNLKAMFPGPSQISLPAVAVGSDYDLGIVDSSAVTTVAFRCDGQPMVVRLFEGPSNGSVKS